MKIEIGILISLIMMGIGILTFLFNMNSGKRNDGIYQGKLENNMDYMKRGIDNIMLEMKDIMRDNAKIKEQQIIDRNNTDKAAELAQRAYNRATEAHERIDKIKGGKD